MAVFFDLEKTYDSTWRGGLFHQFHFVGLRDPLPTFIRNIFSDRLFSVRVSSTLSRPFSQLEEVPQGSLRNVLCFALAFNDALHPLLVFSAPSAWMTLPSTCRDHISLPRSVVCSWPSTTSRPNTKRRTPRGNRCLPLDSTVSLHEGTNVHTLSHSLCAADTSALRCFCV